MRYLIAILTGAAIAMSASAGYPESVADKRELTLEGARQVIAATVDAARELAVEGELTGMIEDTIGRVRWEPLPPWPKDVRERGRVEHSVIWSNAKIGAGAVVRDSIIGANVWIGDEAVVAGIQDPRMSVT